MLINQSPNLENLPASEQARSFCIDAHDRQIKYLKGLTTDEFYSLSCRKMQPDFMDEIRLDVAAATSRAARYASEGRCRMSWVTSQQEIPAVLSSTFEV